MENKNVYNILVIAFIILLATITLSCVYGYFSLGKLVVKQRLVIEELEAQNEKINKLD